MGSAFLCLFTQHGLWIVNKVFIYPKPIYPKTIHPKTFFVLDTVYPIRHCFHRCIPFLKKDNIGHNLCTCICFEGIVGQPDCSQQICTLGKILPYTGVLAVHGMSAGDKGNYAAGANLIESLGKEVVVDRKIQLVKLEVIYFVLPKGDIAYSNIKEVSPIGCFKASYRYVRIWIQFLCNPARN